MVMNRTHSNTPHYISHGLCHTITNVLSYQRENLVLGIAEHWHCQNALLLASLVELLVRNHMTIMSAILQHVGVHHLLCRLEELIFIL